MQHWSSGHRIVSLLSSALPPLHIDGDFIPLLGLCKSQQPAQWCSRMPTIAQLCIIPCSSALVLHLVPPSSKKRTAPWSLLFGVWSLFFCGAALIPSAWTGECLRRARVQIQKIRLALVYVQQRREHDCTCGYKYIQTPGKFRVQTCCWPLFPTVSWRKNKPHGAALGLDLDLTAGCTYNMLRSNQIPFRD